jgi:hypothetical protein
VEQNRGPGYESIQLCTWLSIFLEKILFLYLKCNELCECKIGERFWSWNMWEGVMTGDSEKGTEYNQSTS